MHLRLRGVSFAYIRGLGVAVMLRGKVRSLCAQIAIEINADKVDALIDELTQLLVGEYVNTRAKAEEIQRRAEQIQRDAEKKPATTQSASRIDKDSDEKVS
jgi:hypothetical protein